MNRRMHRIALFALLGLSISAAPLVAESGRFTIAQNGHPVGTATYSISPSTHGLNSSSLVHVSMKGLDYSLSKTESLSPARQLRQVELSAIVNTSAVTLSVVPRGTLFVMDISADGRKTTNRLAQHRSAVLLPDFDPGAFETLLALAAANNNRNLWAIIPIQTGSVEPVQLATYADQSGTLDGKPVVVHHLVATIGGAVTDLFTSPQNHLMQAELPQKGFAMVRNGFVLTQPSNPGAPPPTGASAPPQPVTP